MHARLGDRVQTWTTLNEPWVSAFVGYASGRHAPGVTDPAAAFTVAHHLLKAHMLGVRALRAGRGPGGQPDAQPDPDGRRPRRDHAPRRPGQPPVPRPRCCKDGRYPDDVAAHIAKFTDLDDLPYEPIDLLGVNYYTVNRLAADPASRATTSSPAARASPGSAARRADRDELGGHPAGAGRTCWCGCPVDYPGVPLLITENGAAYPDSVDDQTASPSSTATSGRARTPSNAARTCADTWSGRCSTTSSGPAATASASAWSGSTTTPWSARPEASAHWYREVIARNGL